MKRLLCLLCLASCTPSQPLDAPAGGISALNEALDRTKDSAIPTASEAAISEWEEILEAATFTGHIGRRALQQLENIEAQQRDSILLSLVEKKAIPPESKRIAYSRLAADGAPEIVPRLVLRLRYEKDHSSNVAIAQALLRHGNGSGLAAIRTILSFSSNQYPEAQQAALEFIKSIPPHSSNQEDADAWGRFVRLESNWNNQRTLPGFPAPPIEGPLESEIWSMAARLVSQPLRPVDEARFVLSRMGGEIIPILVHLTRDQNRYLHEHALQTIAWIGAAAGAWADKEKFPLTTKLAESLSNASVRTRALEAIGACAASGAETALLPWLTQGNREEKTASADALLRCGTSTCLPFAQKALGSQDSLGPEGVYSLRLLVKALGAEVSTQPPSGLAPEEQKRRDRWSRARRPAAEPQG